MFAAEGDADRLALRLGEGAIAAPAPPGVCALVPDPDAPGRRQELEAAARERPMALGPTVPWAEAATSAGARRTAARLVAEGLIDSPTGLIAAEDHALTLLTHADPRLAADMAGSSAAPAQRRDRGQPRAPDGHAACLAGRQGRTEAVAGELHVHPQTVRYRLGRLRELFGDFLDEPDGRFELELALRAARAGRRGARAIASSRCQDRSTDT